MSFEEAYENWKIYAMKRHKKQSFENLCKDFNNRVLPCFFGKDIYSLTENDILKWKDYVLSFSFSNSHNDNIYYVFTLFYDYICLYHNVEENLLRKVGPFKKHQEVHKSDFYTYKEFKRFIKGFDNIVYKSYFIFMFYCGTRPSEAMALKFSDIHGKHISINKSIERRGTRDLCTCKNVYSERVVPLPRVVIKYLKKLKKMYGFDSDYFIFGGKKPLAPTSIDRYKKNACKKMNIRPITQHQFRHSYATNLICHRIPVNSVSKLLGHSNTDTTIKVYIHNSIVNEKRVLRTLNSYFL